MFNSVLHFDIYCLFLSLEFISRIFHAKQRATPLTVHEIWAKRVSAETVHEFSMVMRTF